MMLEESGEALHEVIWWGEKFREKCEVEKEHLLFKWGLEAQE